MDSNYVCVPCHLYQILEGMGSKKLEFSRNLLLGEDMAEVLGASRGGTCHLKKKMVSHVTL